MAYHEDIDFITDAKQRLMVPRSVDLGFADDGETLTAKVRRFKDCWMRQDGKQFAIFAGTALEKVGFLWYDVTDKIEFKHCVIVGMGNDNGKKVPQNTYYFLLVREKLGGEGYERLGVGKVQVRYVANESDAGKL
ncbi:hypothetical protein FOZG_16977 [Fusarium oxysporum Fo47]|uniref:Uncharacterized protein n=2 Tax=Fusarium oxysporum Fo47 TaxID=660027 RepID=W9JIW0_FUSOX|nr:hypothetical protein FOZG_16977 [Fusarium oxysporum Fo47]